jgi:hypothetical protein
MNIIFLDFDGVLNSSRFYGAVKSVCVYPNYKHIGGNTPKSSTGDIDGTSLGLIKLLADETQAKIVLSTSWRLYFPKEWFIELFALLNWKNAPIIDKTPELKKETRGCEIKDFLKSTDLFIDNYVIIDDDDDFFNVQKENTLVQTDYNEGFIWKDYLKAKEILML